MAAFDLDLELIATTQKNLDPKDHYEDISLQIQELVAMSQLMKKSRTDIQSGHANQWEIRVANEGNAVMTQPYKKESVNIGDTMKQATLPFRHVYSGYAIDERIVAANRKPARLVDMVKAKERGNQVDIALLMEQQFWGKPINSDDADNMHGVQYHVRSANATATGGFNGDLASGFTDIYGLNPATYTGLKNWNFTYKTPAQSDAVRKIREALVKTQFKSPVAIPTYSGPPRRGIYTIYDNVQKWEDQAMAQNDDNKNDLAARDGQVMIRRIPVSWVPYLEAAQGWTGPASPIYGLDWGVMKMGYLAGEVFKKLPPYRKNDSQRVIITPTYATGNIMNYNGRAHWVGYLN